LEHAVTATPGVKDDAAAAIAMRVRERSDLYVDASLAHRRDDQVTLPAAIRTLAQMLHCAAAANPEMSADWVNPQCTRLLHIHKTPAVRVTWHRVHFDGLARQSPWDVNQPLGAVGYAIAVLAETIDQNPLNHAGPR
jgi:hypothetical protein